MAGTPPRSPLAPEQFPNLPRIGGVSFSAVAAGVKYQGRTDVMLAQIAPGSSIAGVFTKSSTRAAPVLDCQAKIGGDSDAGAAVIVNSGNANAFTGKNGIEATRAVTNAVASALDLPETRVFSSSTGVIGEPLAHDRITAKIVELQATLDEDAIEAAAEAIRTTDTFAKGAGAEINLHGSKVSIAGIAKGSGMIAPDMATMLVYIFTDAQIERADLQAMVSELNEVTFNSITVDSDTSTSDSLLIAATGASGVDVTNNADFKTALHGVMKDLALQVVRDGEGATKLVEIQVTGALNDAEARTHGLSIANSPLVKTAIAGEDPNWGRIVMAIGKSGATADRDLLSIRFGDVRVADKGWVCPDYHEDDGATYMKQSNLVIGVDLGIGSGKSTVWTCDLTHGYITINADYRS
ncbi:glutamate N-acetyltransferase [Planktotalea frisia]|uniref:Arginine biosynthesis bifunctional protein ArgJ n=1 Tax=Planktotalea frisia TaxID=696762 RepID=A0A1L9P068_9RHOB|nr:bifunctional glutamate N-acetyltransferase/amino-acid acetyltransferase ArgJ [Planktotalea frisia]OJI94935.1 arginine biosynthesis bifunctional protein ArgJ [Planktotalea frisia]PZX31406.1 glutamate N-acetyltransferase [Planktotalea frisia]